jgi:hypothetical protein
MAVKSHVETVQSTVVEPKLLHLAQKPRQMPVLVQPTVVPTVKNMVAEKETVSD